MKAEMAWSKAELDNTVEMIPGFSQRDGKYLDGKMWPAVGKLISFIRDYYQTTSCAFACTIFRDEK